MYVYIKYMTLLFDLKLCYIYIYNRPSPPPSESQENHQALVTTPQPGRP